MGASDATGADFMGEIGEIWAFSDTITADEREAVTSKLGAKWDIDVAVPSSSDSSPFGRNDDTETIKPLVDNDNLDIGTGDFSCGNITPSGTVDGIDIATDVAANTAKVTNADHTGEVTGSGALTLNKTAISNKTIVTAADTDYVLITDASDSDNLKKALASDFGGGGAFSTTGGVTSNSP
jgi:hypothetical protein